MLKYLVLREVAFDETGNSKLDELSPERPAVVPVGEEAVVYHLHRDRAEPFANAKRTDIAEERAQEAAPIESVVLVEAAVFCRDERLLDVRRNVAKIDVDAAYDRQMADEPPIPVDDVAAFARMEGPNLRGRRTAGVSACEEPAVDGGHSHDRRTERGKANPVTPD